MSDLRRHVLATIVVVAQGMIFACLLIGGPLRFLGAVLTPVTVIAAVTLARPGEELDLLARQIATRRALAELVRLKDGPRDAEYERAKPIAWANARAVLDEPGGGPAELP